MEANLIARLGVIGDEHLDSKQYGNHKDYPSESIQYYGDITTRIEKYQLTHLIGAGDFSNKAFNLKFRCAIDKLLGEQNAMLKGNRYEVKGNHDIVTRDMSEYDYYIEKELLKPSTVLDIGNLHLVMLDYNTDWKNLEEIKGSEGQSVVVVAHEYFKFEDTKLPNFGEAIILDNYEAFKNVDVLICGHIHTAMAFEGDICGHHCQVTYLGCPMRPAYRSGFMDMAGHMAVISVYDDGLIDVRYESWELPAIEDVFDIAKIEEKQKKKEETRERIDISETIETISKAQIGGLDIVSNIRSMNIDEKYKKKALQLLQES